MAQKISDFTKQIRKKCPQNSCDGSTNVTIVVILELECIVWNELQNWRVYGGKIQKFKHQWMKFEAFLLHHHQFLLHPLQLNFGLQPIRS